MDCFEARPLLPLLARSDEPSVELHSIHEHLAGCAACRAAMDAELRGDHELSQRLLAVPVPADLSGRLLSEFSVTRPANAIQSTSRLNRRRWSITAFAASLVVLGGFLSFWWLRPVRQSLREIQTTISSAEWTVNWRTASGLDLPAGWSQVRGLQAETPRGMPAARIPLQAMRFSFQPSRSSPPVTGHLWLIESARIIEAQTIAPLEFAQIQYTPGHPHLVWSERGVVYLLEAGGDVLALERLQQALRKSRSIA